MRKYTLLKDILDYGNLKPYVYSHCKKTFSQGWSMRKHEENTHKMH